jgi:hypothetical protein
MQVNCKAAILIGPWRHLFDATELLGNCESGSALGVARAGRRSRYSCPKPSKPPSARPSLPLHQTNRTTTHCCRISPESSPSLLLSRPSLACLDVAVPVPPDYCIDRPPAVAPAVRQAFTRRFSISSEKQALAHPTHRTRLSTVVGSPNPSGATSLPLNHRFSRLAADHFVKISPHEARASLLGGQPLDTNPQAQYYQPYAAPTQADDYRDRDRQAFPAQLPQRRVPRMYFPTTRWTWAFTLTSLAQAIVAVALEACVSSPAPPQSAC